MAQEFPSPTPVGPGPVQEFPVPPQVPPQKNKNTLWIILAIVVVLLCCCCLLGVLYYLYTNGDQLLNNFQTPSGLIPFISSHL